MNSQTYQEIFFRLGVESFLDTVEFTARKLGLPHESSRSLCIACREILVADLADKSLAAHLAYNLIISRDRAAELNRLVSLGRAQIQCVDASVEVYGYILQQQEDTSPKDYARIKWTIDRISDAEKDKLKTEEEIKEYLYEIELVSAKIRTILRDPALSCVESLR